MKNYKGLFLVSFFLVFFGGKLCSQNEASKWCFGNQTGLDFMTNPPSAFTHTMNTVDGCASIADAAGNLLFYTDGAGLWNSQNQPMAGSTVFNGQNLFAQTSVVVKQPGNANIYYIFTPECYIGSLFYITIDMNLAAGLGSVTAFYYPLIPYIAYNNTIYDHGDKISATKHCNGTDIWVVTKKSRLTMSNGNNSMNGDFWAFLVTAAGVNTTAVVSPANTWTNTYVDFDWTSGCMKFSPNGTKLGLANTDYNYFDNFSATDEFEIWDFNNSTGVVTNSLALSMNSLNNLTVGWSYGCEFSPDGTKFYGSKSWTGVNTLGIVDIGQWDLCAGSPQAIAASLYPVAPHNQNYVFPFYSMQMAPNGKIYVARGVQTALDVINNPNVAGAGCNYVPLSQFIGNQPNCWGLPNFMTSYFQVSTVPPFTYTINTTTSCLTTSFTAPNPTLACASLGYSVTGIQWDFGDPVSGPANTSALYDPVHTYSAPGTYTAQLIYLKTCGADTVALPIVIKGADLTINTTSITCASLGSATVTAMGGVGPFSYTWMPTAQTNSVATGLYPGNYSLTMVDNGGNCAYTTTVSFISPTPFTGQLDNSPSIPCNGVGTGTAMIALFGGSGTSSYYWSNGVTTQTTAAPNNLTGGIYTVTVVDALTSCSVIQTFFINQPPALNLNIVASSATACAGTGITFTATNSGGTPGPLPGYTYTWTGGPNTDTYTVNQAVASTYNYSVTSTDGNNCSISNSISVSFVPNPTLTVSDVSICPLQTGTLVPSGASSYTWLPSGLTTNTFTDSPLTTTNYTLNGAALGCSATPVTVNIVLKSVPSPTLSSNSPVCNGQLLSFSSSPGASYQWSGPLLFGSSLQTPSINLVSPNNSGIYSLTLTAANSCTASVSISATVNLTPTLTAFGSTVCSSQTLNLTANSVAGNTYLWEGPLSFTSTLQNIALVSPSVNQTGSYIITTTSTEGCTNTATAFANVVAPPSLTVSFSSPSLCAQALNGSPNTITLTSSGAVTYTLSTPNHINNPNPAGPNSPLNMVPPYQPTGPATATLFGSNGVCTVSTSAIFTIMPNPTVSISNPTPVICVGQSFTYTSAGADSYTWSTFDPTNFIYTSGDVAVANPTINSVFSVIGTSLGCNSAIQSSSMTVNPLPVFSVATASICLGSSAILTANGNATSFTWSPTAFLNVDNTQSVIANPPADQSYMVTGALNNCTSAAIANVLVMPLPVVSLVASKQELCLYDKVELTGGIGQYYEWFGPGNVYLTGQQVSYQAMNMSQSGTFTLTVTDARGCKNSSTTNLLIKSLPTGTISGNHQGCVPLCTELSFSTSASVSSSWIFNGQGVNANPFKHCFDVPGNYTITTQLVDAITTCSNALGLEINVYPKPSADFNFFPELPVENMDEVLFTNTSTGSTVNSFNWFFINNQGYKATTENVSYLFENAGVYPVALVIKNNLGCADTVVKAVTVEPDFNIYVPNAFTPNDDGRNEVFQPVGRGVTKYYLQIFDRWGEKIFTSTDFSKGWDGFYKGQPAKEDVYAWKIDAVSVNGITKNLTGHVTLYR